MAVVLTLFAALRALARPDLTVHAPVRAACRVPVTPRNIATEMEADQ